MGTITNFAGKYTDPNLLNLPSGAARDAVNVVSDRPGVAECRVGMDVDADPFVDDAERLSSGVVYGAGTVESTGGQLYRRNLSEGLVNIGALTPAGSRLRFAVGGDDLYMTSASGVVVMDGPDGTPKRPGLPRAYDPLISDFNNGGVGPYPDYEYSGAYRIVFTAYDAENRPIMGEPSGRIVFAPSTFFGGARIVVPLPPGLYAGVVAQVYRTTVSVGQAGPPAVTVDPGDQMFLAAEHVLTSSDVSTGNFVINDLQPNTLLGPPLYTNTSSTLGGIGMSNLRPPLAQEVVLFRQSLFLADVSFPQGVNLRLIGLPASGDTITIAGMTYTAGAITNGTGTFGVVDTGSTSSNIERTARELAIAINSRSGNTRISAYYVSGENDPPGMLRIVDRDVGGATFAVSATGHPDRYEPVLTSPINSTNDAAPNGISVSKSGLFYAFPSDSSYHLHLGRADKRILRLIVNRDSLFAFKEDGVWVIYPAGAGWGYRQISTDIILQYPDSLAVLDNQVYAFTNRGIVAVDESGIEEVDAPIKNYVSAIRDTTLTAAPQSVFAVADPVRLRYTLFFWDGGSEDTTAATHALVYNGKTDTWTERDDHATGGFIGADGLLWLGNDTNPNVRRERNTGTASDYKDPANTPIHVTIEWAAIISENPSGASRFTEMHLLTEEPTEGPYTFTFTSHYGESETCQPEGENLPEVRMWVPDGVQRTTRLKVRMERDVLEESFAVLGITNSAKYYRGPATRG